MKTPIIAAGLLVLASGASSAQSNVTLYGIVDVGLRYGNAATSNDDTLSVGSGQQRASRLGFRGTEALGNGLSASFQLESGFNADDGTLGYGNRLFGRQSWVGLNGAFGSIRFGRQTTALYDVLFTVDPFVINGTGNAQRVFGYGLGKTDPLSRADNSVTYHVDMRNGFGFSAGHAFGERTGGFASNSSDFASVSYVTGRWNVRAAYQHSDGVDLGASSTQLGALVPAVHLAAASVKVKGAIAGAVYDFGSFKLHGIYGDTRAGNGGAVVMRSYMTGVTVGAGRGTICASWNRNDIRNLRDGVSDQYGLDYTYPLSKRTLLYAAAGYTNNGGDVRLNSARNGFSGREVETGIRHTF
ncbi:porin [Massilia sp. TW-1]|uniref:Porin n=1 Tax=Telluria antibiotica TaxID=2717319 RepID=A0ABX0P5B3_9BURK|nr:porin [Telluria antibiotica]NIA52414.1 porin [Telluria antibiotica]